jgi:hypothetical protein
MRNITIWFVLIILTGFMGGCEKTGYMFTISTDHLKYEDFQQIGKVLRENGFEIVVWEGKTDIPKYPNEVYTLFRKKLSSKPFYLVIVHLIYVKDLPNNVVPKPKIDVHNIYQGATIAELKDEIGRIGNLICQELTDRVGKGNVMIERKEIHGQAMLF